MVRSGGQEPPRRVQSGIAKTVVSSLSDPILHRLGPLGIEGDEQCDLTVHGGPQKALYAYTFAHYAFWKHVLTEHQGRVDRLENPGAMGENLSIEGLSEDTVYLGDEWLVGDVVLRVTEPREPCFKFNAVMGWSGAAKAMFEQACSGWYLSVVTPGVFAAGSEIHVLDGPRRQTVRQAFLGKKSSTL